MEQLEQEQNPFSPEDSSEPQSAPEPIPEESETDAPVPAGEPTVDAAAEEAPAPADAAPTADAPAAGGDGEFSDKVINCTQCGAEFVHTASAQAFYKEKGFANEPKRCAPCRKARKSQGGGGGGGYSERDGGSRQMFPATCADCGKETEVPFKPSGARPVYCLDCYRKQRDG